MGQLRATARVSTICPDPQTREPPVSPREAWRRHRAAKTLPHPPGLSPPSRRQPLLGSPEGRRMSAPADASSAGGARHTQPMESVATGGSKRQTESGDAATSPSSEVRGVVANEGTPQGSIAALVWKARDAIRGSHPQSVLLALVAEARLWASARDGAPRLRGAAGPLVTRDLPRLPPEIVEAQRRWLDSASEAQRTDYIPQLVRGFSQRPEEAVHLSSEPISQVAVAALVARLRLSDATSAVVYDPACGTGGMLLTASQALRAQGTTVRVYGQELSTEAAFIAAVAVEVSGLTGEVAARDSLVADAWPDMRYDFAVAEPPYGMGWHGVESQVRALRAAGHYPGGLPSRSDSALLFVQHLIEKMRPASDGGGRAVVFTAPSALRSPGGDAIRRWLLAEDLLEAVVALPEGISAGTGIRVDALVLTNRRPRQRTAKVQVVDLRGAFEDRSRSRVSRRRLREDALDSLTRALSSVKPGPISRTATGDHFVRREVKVRSGRPGEQSREWTLALSLGENPVDYVTRHIAEPPSEVVATSESTVCRIDVDDVLNRESAKVAKWMKDRGWPITRLAAVSDDAAYLPSASSAERSVALQRLEPGPRVMLPIEPHHPAVYADPSTDALERRFIAFTTDPALRPEFLVGYLNSTTGVAARTAAARAYGASASPRTVSRSERDGLLANLAVPIPDPATQHRVIDADERVQAAVAHAVRTAEDLWRTPERCGELVKQVERPSRAQTLVDWTRELPYPLASALWASQAAKGNAHAENRQLFLFWEAVAAFTGTVLLSALDEDKSLREVEMESLRSAIAAAHLSMQRATLGVWRLIIQRLGSRFRRLLDSPDADERARVSALFAGAPDDLVRAICSLEMTALVDRINKKRNDWSGHGGATPPRVLADQNAWLTEQIQSLRDVFDGAWAGAPLVRAGSMAYEHGAYIHDVELVMGLNTPFLGRAVTLGAPMEKGELYIVTDGAQRGLRVEPFVQLRESPDSAQYACYFYNRLEGQDARLVSYHVGSEAEVRERSPGLSNLVASFDVLPQ